VKGDSWLARGAVVAAVGAAGALALAGLYRGNNPDTFGHLAQGRQIAALGHVPALDTWSLLPGPPRPWHNYEWLSDLATWSLYDGFGYPAVTIAKCLLLAIAALCLSRTAQLWGGARAAVLGSLAAVSTIPAIRVRLSDRPHVLGIALAASYLLLLTLLSELGARAEAPRGSSDGTTRAWQLPARRRAALLVSALFALHVLWINTHGGHLLYGARPADQGACEALGKRAYTSAGLRDALDAKLFQHGLCDLLVCALASAHPAVPELPELIGIARDVRTSASDHIVGSLRLRTFLSAAKYEQGTRLPFGASGSRRGNQTMTPLIDT